MVVDPVQHIQQPQHCVLVAQGSHHVLDSFLLGGVREGCVRIQSGVVISQASGAAEGCLLESGAAEDSWVVQRDHP